METNLKVKAITATTMKEKCNGQGIIGYYNGENNIVKDKCEKLNDGISDVDTLPIGPPDNTLNPSIDFTETDQYIEIKNIDIPEKSRGITIAMWINQRKKAGNKTLISIVDKTKNELYFATDITGDYHRIYWKINREEEIEKREYQKEMNTHQWYHITHTINIATLMHKEFINGEEIQRNHITNGYWKNIPKQIDICFGQRVENGVKTNGYDGGMDDMIIYHRELNETEIKKLVDDQQGKIKEVLEKGYYCYDRGPNEQQCSGHGECTKEETCECEEGYKGEECERRQTNSECPINLVGWLRGEQNTKDRCEYNQAIKNLHGIEFKKAKLHKGFYTQGEGAVHLREINLRKEEQNEMTISGWFKLEQAGTLLSILQENQKLNIQLNLTHLSLNNNGTRQSKSMMIQEWNMITMTINKTQCHVYANGQYMMSDAIFEMTEKPIYITFFQDQYCPHGCYRHPFEGYGDELLLYNTTLSQTEITQLYAKEGLPYLNCFGLKFNDENVCSRKGRCEQIDECVCFPSYTGEKCDDSFQGKTIGTFGYGATEMDGSGFLTDHTYSVPMSRMTMPKEEKVRNISCGAYHCFVWTNLKRVYGFGRNEAGQLGLPAGDKQQYPILIPQLNDLDINLMCETHAGTIMLLKNQSLYSFGSYIALGDGTGSTRYHLASINHATNISTIQCGEHHAMYLTTQETGFAWGGVGLGLPAVPLGDSAFSQSMVPIQIQIATPIKQLVTGYRHGLALNHLNQVLAWGTNDLGQLGQNHYNNRLFPVQILLFNGLPVKNLFAGGHSSFALLETGVIYAWGANAYGQLGVTNVAATVPLPELVQMGLPNSTFHENTTIYSIQANNISAYALSSLGTIYSVGSRMDGSLGDSKIVGQQSVFKEILNITSEHAAFEKMAAREHGLFLLPGSFCGGQYVTETSTICSGHGRCIDINECECVPEWGGDLCKYPVCYGYPSTDNDTCSGHGTCISQNICQCTTNYTGDNCQNHVCYGIGKNDPNVCSQHGQCINHNDCQCTSPFTGDQCQYPTCFQIKGNEPNVCSSYGTCINTDVCQCVDSHEGNQCQYEKHARPVAYFTIPNSVRDCDTLLLDARLAIGLIQSYKWTINNGLTNHVYTTTSSTRSIDPTTLALGAHVVTLEVTDNKGYVSLPISKQIIRHQTTSLPSVLIDAPTEFKHYRNSTLRLKGRITTIESCADLSNIATTTNIWSQESGSTVSFKYFENTMTIQPFSFPCTTGTFTFAYTGGTTQLAKQSVRVLLQSSNPVPVISGGSVRTHYSRQDLTLNGEQSYDPDQCTSLTYSWSCTALSGLASCPGALSSTSQVTITQPIFPGNYSFTLTVNKNGNVQQTSVIIIVTEFFIPSVFMDTSVKDHNLVDTSSVVRANPSYSSLTTISSEYWQLETQPTLSLSNIRVLGTFEDSTARKEISFYPKYLSGVDRSSHWLKYVVKNIHGVGFSLFEMCLNKGPSQGSVSVSPTLGTLLETKFTIIVSHYMDVYHPLSFKYEVKRIGDHDDHYKLLDDYSLSNRLHTTIGLEGTLRLRISIMDRLGAVTTVTNRIIVVQKPTQLSTTVSSMGMMYRNQENIKDLNYRISVITSQAERASDRNGLLYLSALSDAMRIQSMTLSNDEHKDMYDSIKGQITTIQQQVCSLNNEDRKKVVENVVHLYSNIANSAIQSNQTDSLTTILTNANVSIHCLFDTLSQTQVPGAEQIVIDSSVFSVLYYKDYKKQLSTQANRQDILGNVLSPSRVRPSSTLNTISEEPINVQAITYDSIFQSLLFPETVEDTTDSNWIFHSNITKLDFIQNGAVVLQKHLTDPISLIQRGFYNFTTTLGSTKELVIPSDSGKTYETHCVYYDESKKTWSNQGCKLLDIAIDKVICVCNHTSFYAVRSHCVTNCYYEFDKMWIPIIILIVLSVLLACIVCCLILIGLCLLPRTIRIIRERRRIKAKMRRDYITKVMNNYAVGMEHDIEFFDDTIRKGKKKPLRENALIYGEEPDVDDVIYDQEPSLPGSTGDDDDEDWGEEDKNEYIVKDPAALFDMYKLYEKTSSKR